MMFVDEKRQGEIAVDPARDVLVEAKRLLIESGWCQGDYHKGDTFCSVGAMSRSANRMLPAGVDLTSQFPPYRDAYIRLMKIVGGAVSLWNDQPIRTKAEVLAAFDRAIAL
jgi:hypothetical protein